MATNSVLDWRHHYRETRRLALAGILGPPFFVVVFLVLGFIKPGYDPVVRFVSEGSIGELGWIQIVNFLVFGATLLVFSLALWQGFGDRLSGRIGSVLIGIVGVGAVGAGVFVSDPDSQIITTHGALHESVSLVAFVGLALACFFFAKRFWSDLPFAVYSIATGALIPVTFASIDAIGRPGLVQRVMIIVVWTWLTILALRLWRAPKPRQTVR